MAKTGQLLGGDPVTVDGRAVLKIVNTNDTALSTQLVKLLQPPITKRLYAIVGEVKYSGVRGSGFLEMWTYFPPAKPGMLEAGYFSRTLAESGELAKITGTSDWRHFMLPFDQSGTSKRPTRLEITVLLPAQGTVYLGPIKLVQYDGSFISVASGAPNVWWPDWAAGLVGGIGGSVVGCLGGLLAWLASKGKARRFVLASLKLLIGLGVLLGSAGIWALSLRKPYGVWFVLILMAVILLAVLPARLKQYQRMYEELELRKMASMDA